MCGGDHIDISVSVMRDVRACMDCEAMTGRWVRFWSGNGGRDGDSQSGVREELKMAKMLTLTLCH